MIGTTDKVAKVLVGSPPLLPAPVVAVVTTLQVATVVCTLVGALCEEAKGWDWPWSS